MDEFTRRSFLGNSALGLGLAELESQAAQEAPQTGRTISKVQDYQGVPTLHINGKPTPALIYFFPIPVKEHIAGFYRAGIRIYSWGNGRTMSGDCYDMGWTAPGQFDYSRFDKEMALLLEVAPEAYMFPRIAVSAPNWWLAGHPDDKIVCDRDDGGRAMTSMASATWRRDAADAVTRFIKHVRSMPYAKHVIGYQLVGGQNEWFYVGSGGRGFPDFSPAAIATFRTWLKANYDSDVARLRAAWKMKDVEFENAPVPKADQRLKADVGLLRDPAVSRQVSDYHQFISETQAEALIQLAGAAKKACDGESLVGAFYGYLLNATGGFAGGYAAVNWGHQALRKVAESPDVDFLCAPYQYTYRGMGGYPGSQGLPETVKLRGKLWITECDNPPFIVPPGEWRMGAADYTPAQSFAVLKRDFAHNFIRRDGMWWMDLTAKGGWYNHPDIEKFLRRSKTIAERSAHLKPQSKAEIAVFIDEETPYYVKPGPELLYPLVFLQDKLGLPRMGAPVDFYLHNDLSRPNMPEYKVNIFLNTIYLTGAEREAIKARVCKGNKVAVWMYAPGLISEAGLLAQNMRDLTGIKLNFRKVPNSNQMMCNHVYLTDYRHPITNGLTEGTYFGSDAPISPVIFSEDSEATTLGRLIPSHGMPEQIGEFPAFVVKKFADWTSVFIGVPDVPCRIWRNIARLAGCHIYNDQDAIIDANSHFLAIHTAAGGRQTLRLRQKSDVYDAYTEQRVARQVSEFTDELPPYGTRLYFLGDMAEIADQATRFTL
jgi:hypothetical protein